MPAQPAYSERIARRRRMWWEAPRPGGRTVRDAAHRLRERRRLLGRDDPDEAWRCCAAWPRQLLTKPNGREYAARFGCRLPQLYWSGSDPAAAPLEDLGGDFVLRPFTGYGHAGVLVVVEGRDALRDEPAAPADIRARWPRDRLRRPRPVLLEERIRREDAASPLPLELKLHLFGEVVGAIERTDRRDDKRSATRFYTPAWEPVADRMNAAMTLDDPVGPPRELAGLLALGGRIGASLGTYMRVDFFAAEDGLVFNEFSSTPLGGRGFTAYGEELLGRLWAEHVGDAV